MIGNLVTIRLINILFVSLHIYLLMKYISINHGESIYYSIRYCFSLASIIIQYKDPSLTTLPNWQKYCFAMLDLAKRMGWD